MIRLARSAVCCWGACFPNDLSKAWDNHLAFGHVFGSGGLHMFFFTTHRFLSHHYRDDDGHDDYDDNF